MRFGKSAQEAAEEPGRGGQGGDFIRYLKDGDTTLRILQEPDEWTYWWEHFDQGRNISYPCPRGANDPIEDCPGCSSENEKTAKVGRKIGFNVLTSWNGTEYVNAFKVGPTVADKLKNRHTRLNTITDRDYTITRYKTTADRYDFDVEGGTPTPVNLRKEEWKDIEEMLVGAYEDAWGDGPQAQANRQGEPREAAVAAKVKRAAIAPQPVAVAPEEPPFEPEKVYAEEELRAMAVEDLLVLVKSNLALQVPDGLSTSNEVVDWLLTQQ